MLLSRLVARSLMLCTASLALAASVALADHVPGVLPLASLSNHSHEQLSNTAFPLADLTGINFAVADLSNCTFAPGTNLTGANFTGAKLVNANFNGCNLTQANFRGADLSFAVLGCAEFGLFHGAILTGAVSGCGACAIPGSNVKDVCTVGDVPQLCLAPGSFRGVIEGVVFIDANNNGAPDLGEAGVGGITLVVDYGTGPNPVITDGRGAYSLIATAANPATVQLASPLPVGLVLSGSASHAFNLATCRSGQGRDFPVVDIATPAKTSTFGQLKLYYR